MLKVTYKVFDGDRNVVDMNTYHTESLNFMFSWIRGWTNSILRNLEICEWNGTYKICVKYFEKENEYTMKIVAVEDEQGVVFSNGEYYSKKHCARFVKEWLDEKIQELGKEPYYVE